MGYYAIRPPDGLGVGSPLAPSDPWVLFGGWIQRAINVYIYPTQKGRSVSSNWDARVFSFSFFLFFNRGSWSSLLAFLPFCAPISIELLPRVMGCCNFIFFSFIISGPCTHPLGGRKRKMEGMQSWEEKRREEKRSLISDDKVFEGYRELAVETWFVQNVARQK